MNTSGLVANLLYLGESDFGPAPTDNRPRLSFAGWVDYVLTNYATVTEVVDAFTNPSIYIVPMNFGPGFAGHPTDAPVGRRRLQRLRGHRIPRRQAGDPPRPAVPVMTNSPPTTSS